MILIHLQHREGEVLVRLPDGSTQWVAVGELIALAQSDKPARHAVAEPEPTKATKKTTRKK